MKTYKKIVSLLVCVVLCIGFSVIASAGSVVTVLDNNSFAKELSTLDWHNADEDITVKGGKLIFPKESSSSTKLVWKNPLVKSTFYDKLIDGDTTIKFTKLPSGETFVLAFGLSTIESDMGSPSSLEIQFKNNGGICASVVTYDENGNASVIGSSKRVGSLNSNINLKFSITCKDKITVSANNVSICKNANIKHTAEGRLGFLQSGNCGAEISLLNFKSYAYDTPENANISEDFEDGEFNANLFSTVMVAPVDYPATADIQELNGHKGLLWRNARLVYFSTKYVYSNFEFTYDVVYQQNGVVLDEKGELVTRAMPSYVVRFGCDSNSMNAMNFAPTSYAKQLTMGNGNYMLLTGGTTTYGNYTKEGFNFFDESTSKKGYSVKLRMVDGVFTGYVKWLSDKSWGEPVFTIDESNSPTPSGFIQIIGQEYTYMMLDNIKITNLDHDPNLIDIEYKTNKQEMPKDYEYTPMEVVYMPESPKKQEEKGFNFYLITAAVGGAAVIAVGVTVLVSAISRKKRLKKAGESVDE